MAFTDNKLLLQYLAAGGQDLLSGQPIGANVNAVTQQNIGAQNMAKLLKQLLASGGKMTMDQEKTKLDFPTSMFSAPDGTAQNVGPGGTTGPTASAFGVQNPKPAQSKGMSQLELAGLTSLLGGSSFLNPSGSQLDIAAADLAGLTTDDISKALQLKLASDELGQQKISDVIDANYKLSKIAKAGEPDPLDRPFLGGYTLREFKSLSSDLKEYELARAQAAAMGDDSFMTLSEWKDLEPTDRTQFLEELVSHPDPRVRDLAREIYGPTRISIGEKTEQVAAVEDVKSRKALTTADFAENVQKAWDKSAKAKSTILMDDRDARRAEIKWKDKYIRRAIAGTGGKIINARMDGGVRVYEVEYPDGTKQEVRYAF